MNISIPRVGINPQSYFQSYFVFLRHHWPLGRHDWPLNSIRLFQLVWLIGYSFVYILQPDKEAQPCHVSKKYMYIFFVAQRCILHIHYIGLFTILYCYVVTFLVLALTYNKLSSLLLSTLKVTLPLLLFYVFFSEFI